MALPKTRIVVVDDHAIVRHGLIDILKSQPDLEVCAEVSSGHEAVETVKQLRPDLVLADLTLPDMDGVQVVEAIRAASPGAAIVVLTMHSSEAVIRAALKAGAQGYVVKSDAATDLLAAVRSVREKHVHLTPRLQEVLIGAFVGDEAGAPEDEGAAPGTLSAREREIVRLLASGRSNKEVASALELSLRTVESHRYHIMRKMQFDTFSDLVRFALREGIASL